MATTMLQTAQARESRMAIMRAIPDATEEDAEGMRKKLQIMMSKIPGSYVGFGGHDELIRQTVEIVPHAFPLRFCKVGMEPLLRQHTLDLLHYAITPAGRFDWEWEDPLAAYFDWPGFYAACTSMAASLG